MWLKVGLFVVVLLGLVWAQDSAETTTPNTPLTTLTPEQECAKGNASCDDCLKVGVKCLWCSSPPDGELACRPYPSGDIIPHSSFCKLSNARWGVCWLNYEALIISMGVIAGAILISCACFCYCCCCKSKSSNKKYQREEARIERERESRNQRHQERRAERQSRLNEIRQKYGIAVKSLVKDDNQYERFNNEQDA